MRREARGFTLVEILVVLGVLGMIALLLAGGIGAGTRTWDRARGKAQGVEDMLALSAFLDVHLRRALPARLSFTGEPDRVSFIAPLPEGVARPGLGRLTLGLDRASGRLTLDWQGLFPQAGHMVREGAVRRTPLAENVQDAAFRYRGRADGRWRTSWPPGPELPDLVEVTVTPRDAAPWPPLRVRPRLDGPVVSGFLDGG